MSYIDRDAFLAEQRHLYCENCARRKNGKGKFVYDIGDAPCRACGYGDVLDDVENAPAADVRPVPEGGIGEMSDGYHTFNGLYYQRMVLFAALVNAHKDKAWKSWKHEDGELCFGGDWFIVGIDTPEGSYTYHYEEKDWELFDCVELPVAKHWDGHTEEDVIRLLSLDVRPVVLCRDCKYNCGAKTWVDHEITADCTNGHGYPPLDWFCADGKKREDS